MGLLDRITAVDALDVASRRVLVRLDLDVPVTDGRVADDARIREALPTLKHLLGQGARVIVLGHLGRGRREGRKSIPSLEPVAAQLAELLAQDVVLADECVGDGARKVVHDLRDGRLAMLENLRGHDGEEGDDETFARDLARLGDVYVNDTLRASLRATASVSALARVVPVRAMGLALRRELTGLGKLLAAAEPPVMAVVGGGRVDDKMRLLESLLGRVESVLLGGAVANVFLAAQGRSVGRSSVDPTRFPAARDWLARAASRGCDVLVPEDLVVGAATDADEGRRVRAEGVPTDAMALDIGPATIELYRQRLMRARTILWDGPMGFADNPAFAVGTAEVARAIVDAAGYSVVISDDSVAAAYKSGLAVRFSHVSRGGPASVELVEGRSLPGVEALRS
jgi:phosphoglycerate kinase